MELLGKRRVIVGCLEEANRKGQVIKKKKGHFEFYQFNFCTPLPHAHPPLDYFSSCLASCPGRLSMLCGESSLGIQRESQLYHFVLEQVTLCFNFFFICNKQV
jgi:hypothetical protein